MARARRLPCSVIEDGSKKTATLWIGENTRQSSRTSSREHAEGKYSHAVCWREGRQVYAEKGKEGETNLYNKIYLPSSYDSTGDRQPVRSRRRQARLDLVRKSYVKFTSGHGIKRPILRREYRIPEHTQGRTPPGGGKHSEAPGLEMAIVPSSRRSFQHEKTSDGDSL